MVSSMCVKELPLHSNGLLVIFQEIHTLCWDQRNLKLINFSFAIEVAGRVANHADRALQFQDRLGFGPIAVRDALVIWRPCKCPEHYSSRKLHHAWLVAEARLLHGNTVLRTHYEQYECQQESVHGHPCLPNDLAFTRGR